MRAPCSYLLNLHLQVACCPSREGSPIEHVWNAFYHIHWGSSSSPQLGTSFSQKPGDSLFSVDLIVRFSKPTRGGGILDLSSSVHRLGRSVVLNMVYFRTKRSIRDSFPAVGFSQPPQRHGHVLHVALNLGHKHRLSLSNQTRLEPNS